jgi:hypothetical protein
MCLLSSRLLRNVPRCPRRLADIAASEALAEAVNVLCTRIDLVFVAGGGKSVSRLCPPTHIAQITTVCEVIELVCPRFANPVSVQSLLLGGSPCGAVRRELVARWQLIARRSRVAERLVIAEASPWI